MYVVPAALAVLFIAAGFPAILHPLAFEKTPAGFTTYFHLDPGLYASTSLNASEESLAEMQALIDATGPLTLSIRVKDPESAMRDLRQYLRAAENMDHLVIEFDMSESELQAYLEDHQENAQILEELLNETSRFDRLESLELQFADSRDAGQLTTVILQKEAIRNRVREMYGKYVKNSGTIEGTAVKYELDPVPIRQSVADFQEILQEIDANQVLSQRELARLKTAQNFISIFVEPSEVRYGDTLRIWGVSRANGAANRSVRIYIDGDQVREAPVGKDGLFEYSPTIERIGTGLHSVYAQDQSLRSNIGNFSVIEVSSTITLRPDDSANGGVFCFGALTTSQGRGVKGARVELVWDHVHSVTTETDGNGTYGAKVVLPGGTHTIQAMFNGDGFPVSPSVSDEVTVEIPWGTGAGDAQSQPLSFILAAGMILVSGIAAAVYLRRRKAPPRLQNVTDEPPPAPEMPVYDEIMPYRHLSFMDLFRRLLHLGDLREAAFAVYRDFTVRMEHMCHIVRIRALTARELAARTKGQPFHTAVREFVPQYEGVRYGPDPESARGTFESVIEPLDLATRDGEEREVSSEWR